METEAAPERMTGPSQATQLGRAPSYSPFAIATPSPLLSQPSSPPHSQNPYAYDPYWVATQLVTDPRRLGKPGSGLSDDQLSDVFCILHPATLPACRAASLIRIETPENTIDTYSNVNIREKNSSEDAFNSTQLAQDGLESCDIALRLTCRLKDPMGGFQFGRNATRCDFVLGKNEISRRISNIHFRIYINEFGIIMLEDQSTNGTAIDGTLLRGKEKENGRQFRHTLSKGSVITLTMTPPEEDYRFVVRIPHREVDADVKFQKNLTEHFLRRGIQRPTAAGGIMRRTPVSQRLDPRVILLIFDSLISFPKPSKLSPKWPNLIPLSHLLEEQ